VSINRAARRGSAPNPAGGAAPGPLASRRGGGAEPCGVRAASRRVRAASPGLELQDPGLEVPDLGTPPAPRGLLPAPCGALPRTPPGGFEPPRPPIKKARGYPRKIFRGYPLALFCGGSGGPGSFGPLPPSRGPGAAPPAGFGAAPRRVRAAYPGLKPPGRSPQSADRPSNVLNPAPQGRGRGTAFPGRSRGGSWKIEISRGAPAMP
jgi:hypothetical protein